MNDMFYERLLEAKERKLRLEKANQRLKQFKQQSDEQEMRIAALELQLESEQADVDKLNRMSLANLFHTILRSKEEQLEKERQEVLAATLKLQEAKQVLDDLHHEMAELRSRISSLQDAESMYEQLLAEKEAFLRSSPLSASELAAFETRIADQTILVKELDEALTAGKRVLASLKNASLCLEKAENWGKWDLWGGGGMISTYVKHGHVDDAKAHIHNANRLLTQFQKELSDLQRTISIDIDIGDMLKLADYWFDGLIADWIVQGRIQNAQDQTLNAISRIHDMIERLERERSLAAAELEQLQKERVSWIENAPRQE